jgi:hypothetical protein
VKVNPKINDSCKEKDMAAGSVFSSTQPCKDYEGFWLTTGWWFVGGLVMETSKPMKLPYDWENNHPAIPAIPAMTIDQLPKFF